MRASYASERYVSNNIFDKIVVSFERKPASFLGCTALEKKKKAFSSKRGDFGPYEARESVTGSTNLADSGNPNCEAQKEFRNHLGILWRN